MRIINAKELSLADASTSANSDGFDASSVLTCSVQVIATSTIDGDLKVQFSNDPVVTIADVVNWSDVTNATVSVSGAAVYAIEKFDVSYQWLRLVWTFSSGAGAIVANIKTNGY